jgi:hypothetical protein
VGAKSAGRGQVLHAALLVAAILAANLTAYNSTELKGQQEAFWAYLSDWTGGGHTTKNGAPSTWDRAPFGTFV